MFSFTRTLITIFLLLNQHNPATSRSIEGAKKREKQEKRDHEGNASDISFPEHDYKRSLWYAVMHHAKLLIACDHFYILVITTKNQTDSSERHSRQKRKCYNRIEWSVHLFNRLYSIPQYHHRWCSNLFIAAACPLNQSSFIRHNLPA